MTTTTTMTSDIRYVSNSELRTFKRCKRKWWLEWYRGLRYQFPESTGPRQIGTRVHMALAAWYVPDDQDPVDPRDAIRMIIAEDRDALLEADPETDLKIFDSEADLARAMIDGYMDWLEETGADSDLDVIEPESVVTVPLSSFEPRKISLLGRLDVRVRRRHDDAKLFLDHKTVGTIKEATKRLSNDEQMLLYHVIMSLLNEGERVDGAVYNMLRKVKRTATAKPPFYERETINHSRHELNSFWKRLHGTIHDILSTETRLLDGESPLAVVYPTPTRDCSWDCDFALVCPMFDDGSRAEDMLAVHYTQVELTDRYPELFRKDNDDDNIR